MKLDEMNRIIDSFNSDLIYEDNQKIESSLKKLCEEGLIEKRGGGRSTYYIRLK